MVNFIVNRGQLNGRQKINCRKEEEEEDFLLFFFYLEFDASLGLSTWLTIFLLQWSS
jgi:hypothetical protein